MNTPVTPHRPHSSHGPNMSNRAAAKAWVDSLVTPGREWQAALKGRRMRVAKGGRVHLVGRMVWFGGAEVPVPACHTGTLGGPMHRFSATDGAPSCRKCLRIAKATVLREDRQPPLLGVDALMREWSGR